MRPAEKASIVSSSLIGPAAFAISRSFVHISHVGILRQIQRRSRDSNAQIANPEGAASVLHAEKQLDAFGIFRNETETFKRFPVIGPEFS